jgi:hypothetical protein
MNDEASCPTQKCPKLGQKIRKAHLTDALWPLRSSLPTGSLVRAAAAAAAAAAGMAAASVALRVPGEGCREDVEEAALTCTNPADESPSTAASPAVEAATACAAAAGR